MKIRVLFILVFCLLAVRSAASQTVAYSLNDAPLFTVRMPDGWKFESRPNPRNPASKRISGTASKGLVWFGVWVVKDVKTVDQAYKYVQATARTLITDARETKPAYIGEVNGMKAKYSEHTGTMKMQDGKSQVSMPRSSSSKPDPAGSVSQYAWPTPKGSRLKRRISRPFSNR